MRRLQLYCLDNYARSYNDRTAVIMLKDTFFPSLARPLSPHPLHYHPQYTVLITERTSEAYLI